MISNYIIIGVVCKLIGLIWFLKLRHVNPYDQRDSIDDFAKIDEETFQKLQKWENIELDILFSLILLYGAIAFYNVFAILFGFPTLLSGIFIEILD